ncbi:MAG: tRNA lysidine(34) synthetase TilS [Halanaerobiales bacterium]|nr:tRNA lysidine(34) synthetase TilS [Halanaerobiales bacterium]
MSNFKERFKENIAKKRLVVNEDKLLLGISGGPDSLTMLDLFDSLREKMRLRIMVFHLNHLFREEADQEAEYVNKICEERNISSIIKKYDVPSYVKKENLSPEEGARRIRFKFLKEICIRKDIQKVCLAHNKDDLVETVLFNIFRGSGMRGLKGIEDVANIDCLKIIHPLLIFYRSEILDYCEQNSLKPVYDPSNKSNLYSRNRIRNNILPMIEEQINSNVKKSVTRLSETIKEDYDFLDEYSCRVLNDILRKKGKRKYVLDLEGLKKNHPAIIKRILNKVFFKLKGNIDNFYYKNYSDMLNFIRNNKTGDLLDLPDKINLKISYNQLIIMEGTFENSIFFTKTIKKQGRYLLPCKQSLKIEIKSEKLNWRNYKDSNVCIADSDKVNFPLEIRNKRDGDKFVPLGMNGHKKVKDFFIDEKIPDYLRAKIPIIFDAEQKLIWICGFRMDDRFKIDNLSQKTILFEYNKGDLK